MSWSWSVTLAAGKANWDEADGRTPGKTTGFNFLPGQWLRGCSIIKQYLYCGDFYVCFILNNKKQKTKRPFPDSSPVPWPASFPEGPVPALFAADVY